MVAAGLPRTSRSLIPLALVILALIVQIAGVIIELGDEKAFGDNIGGMILLVLLLGLAIVQYISNGGRLDAGREAATTP